MESVSADRAVSNRPPPRRFGNALGLGKRLYNPNRVVFDIDSKVHAKKYLLPASNPTSTYLHASVILLITSLAVTNFLTEMPKTQ